ncbi:amidohydrolase family protein [Cohnella kolymensis]|uniref:amidohydrolase family protein n=1 Tax=Cohnella kolymensis TaxID=1590652 RepID=UPI0006981370|nr:amidohydrolase family protein [Cohnella kolymensis]
MHDVHTHFIPSDVMDWLKENQNSIQAKWLKKDPTKAEFLSINGKWDFELKEAFINADLYLDEQAGAEISHSLVSPIPQLFLYEFPVEITSELSAVYNNSLSKWVNAHGERLSALATVPLNAPEQAAVELERAMDQGLKGAIVASSWSGNLLSESRFTPFWETANRRKAVIFIHPLLNTDPRLSSRMMPNLIGVPWETTVAAADILLSGMLDTYPDVKFLLAHGGGFLPYQIGRLNKGYEKWKAVSGPLSQAPEEYLKRFWYDTVLWNPAALDYLIELVGADRVVQGTDYPFDLCEWPAGFVGSKGFHSLLENNVSRAQNQKHPYASSARVFFC